MLGVYLQGVSAQVASQACAHWATPEALDAALFEAMSHLNGAKLIYALDCEGVQYSSNVSAKGIDPERRGQQLTHRPYLRAMQREQDFQLSPVYVDLNSHEPCVTVLRKVSNGEHVLGCIAIDYDLSSLPQEGGELESTRHWRQIKGDPAIRQNLFQQERVTTAMDEHLVEVNDLVTDLIAHRGVFHVKLHYSSCRATIWLYRDPHRYRIHVLDEIIDPSICLAYAKADYPEDAVVPPQQVSQVFNRLAALRNADSTIYLRSASLNIINGMVGLTFSCDGSHFMSYDEFLGKDDSFWFGRG